MRIACYLEPERRAKSRMILDAFAKGCGGIVLDRTTMAPGYRGHAVYGMWSGTQRLVPQFVQAGVPFWHIDNGWIMGNPHDRYYRITIGGPSPRFIPDASFDRAAALGVEIRPWRRGGRHVLVAPSSHLAGRPFGARPDLWLDRTMELLPTVTDRPIVVRHKLLHGPARPLAADLEDAWCLVTHGSGTAITAALAGIPVFCAPTAGAAMVGCVDLTRIEEPLYPDTRREWIASLCWQQFTLAEMRAGFAWKRTVAAQHAPAGPMAS